jgi:hypothetical protein
MKPDLYTKAVLTAITIMLTAIACNQYANPGVSASAQSALFAGVQISATPDILYFFDTRTGEVSEYFLNGDAASDGKLFRQRKLASLGRDLTVEAK